MTHVRVTNGDVERHGHECVAIRVQCPQCTERTVIVGEAPGLCAFCERPFRHDDWNDAECWCEEWAWDKAAERREKER